MSFGKVAGRLSSVLPSLSCGFSDHISASSSVTFLDSQVEKHVFSQKTLGNSSKLPMSAS
jgi:hypothetical protein